MEGGLCGVSIEGRDERIRMLANPDRGSPGRGKHRRPSLGWWGGVPSTAKLEGTWADATREMLAQLELEELRGE